MAIAVLATGALHAVLYPELRSLPAALLRDSAWAYLVVVAVLLAVLVIGDPRRIDRGARWLRVLTVAMITVISMDTAVASIRLVSAILHTRPFTEEANILLVSGSAIWSTNVIAFAQRPDSVRCADGRQKVTRRRLPADNEVLCTLSDLVLPASRSRCPTPPPRRPNSGGTDSMVRSSRSATPRTALFHLLDLLRENRSRPTAVVGIPLGFIGAAEVKQAQADNDLGLEHIVAHVWRGGSAIACGALNAIARDEL